MIAAAGQVTGAEIATRAGPRRPGDPPMLVAAGERIRSELGWAPRKPALAEMIADAWEFARSTRRLRGLTGRETHDVRDRVKRRVDDCLGRARGVDLRKACRLGPCKVVIRLCHPFEEVLG